VNAPRILPLADVSAMSWHARQAYEQPLRRWLTTETAAAAKRHDAIVRDRWRRAVKGDPNANRWLAGEILAQLPPERPTDALARQLAIDAATRPTRRPPQVPQPRPPLPSLDPWRTPAEDAWTDAQLRAAHAAVSRRGWSAVDLPTRSAAAAYDRIRWRRRRHPNRTSA
jgi:hypothetical protein